MEQEIKTQKEFDDRMQQLNLEQSEAGRPLLDEQRSLNKNRQAIKAEINLLYARYNLLGAKWQELEQERKEINRKYHDQKHQLIMSFPKQKEKL